MRAQLGFVFLMLSATLAVSASIPEEEKCHSYSLSTTLPSPLDSETYLSITSSCEEVDISELDQNDEEIRGSLQRWTRNTDKLVMRRYQLVISPSTAGSGRIGVKVKFVENVRFSPYKLSAGGFTLHIAAGSKLIMRFLSPHPPRWVSDSLLLRFTVDDRSSDWTEEHIQMLMPAWINHLPEATLIE